jgi:uncharacterized Tic20 family protein
MSIDPKNVNIQPPPDKPPYVPTEDERMWALIAHLSYLAGSVIGFPFVGPLVVWLIKKDQSPFVGDQAKEALNFQLAVMVAVLVLIVTCIGAILAPVVGIAALVYSIIAALEANKGVYYRYPYTIRLIQ